MASRPLSKRFLAMLGEFATRFRGPLFRFATRVSRWYQSKLVPALPLPLFLACTLGALELSDPKWLEPATSVATRLVLWVDRGMDEVPPPLEPIATLVTRAVYLVDSGLGKLLPYRPHLDTSDTESAFPRSTFTRSMLGEWRGGGEMTVTLVTLTPEAYAYYLLRQSPVPRDRLACVIKALADQIGALNANANLEDRPVVAIDMDVTPTESGGVSAPIVADGASSAGCGLIETTQCGRRNGGCTREEAQEQIMSRALEALYSNADVIAIAHPRPQGRPRAQRNGFIQRTCCPVALNVGFKGCVHYASPMLVYAPQQAVYDFATKYRDTDQGKEFHFPGLGQQMARLWKASASERSGASHDTPYCMPTLVTDVPSLDDRLQAAPDMVTEHKKIALGLARDAVRYFDVDVPADKTSEIGLYEALQKSFEGLPKSRAYVLTVDSGNTEDKFSVPVVDVPVPGAWVHAAIAVTQSDPQKELSQRVPGRFLELLYWLVVGLLFAAVVDRLRSRFMPSRASNPVWHDIVLVVVPLVAALVFLWFQTVFTTAPKIARGEAAIPALLILGMMMESYLGAHAGHRDKAHLKDGGPIKAVGLARGLQVAGQLLWAAAIAVSLLYMLELNEFAGVRFWQLLAAGVLLGALVVWAGQTRRYVPLPWR